MRDKLTALEAENAALRRENATLLAERDAARMREEDGLIPLKCAMANPRSKAEHERIRRGMKRGDIRCRKERGRWLVNGDDVQLLERAYRRLRRPES
jgi:hypothetical protein